MLVFESSLCSPDSLLTGVEEGGTFSFHEETNTLAFSLSERLPSGSDKLLSPDSDSDSEVTKKLGWRISPCPFLSSLTKDRLVPLAKLVFFRRFRFNRGMGARL